MNQNNKPLQHPNDNQAFFYNELTPTVGLWVNLNEVRDQKVVEALMAAKFPDATASEIRCSNAAGVAQFFHNPYLDTFNMWAWGRFMVGRVRYPDFENSLIERYFEKIGVRPMNEVVNAYCGHFSSDEDFASQIIEEAFDFQMPEDLRLSFDYKAYAEKVMGEHFSSSGNYFRIIAEDNRYCIV